MVSSLKVLIELGFPADGSSWIRAVGSDFEGIEWVGDAPITAAEFEAKRDHLSASGSPDWKGLAAWAKDNQEINTAIATALPLKPIAAGGIGATLLQAAMGDIANFVAYFEDVCIAANVSTQQRDTWADTARDDFNIPSDVVAAIRGQ